MAAYANTVTSTMKNAAKFDQVVGFGLYVGKCDITNYNSTRAKITAITDKFKSLMEVICTTISDNGYILRWDDTDDAFKAYYPTNAHTPTTTTGAIKDDDSAATNGHTLYVVPDVGPPVYGLVAEGSATGLILDSDTASSDGIQVYVVIDDVEFLPGFNLGHLEFVSPTNAHATCTVATGAQTLLIEDDDSAASNGTALLAQAAGAGLMSNMAGTNRTLIPLSDGNYIDIEDGTSGENVFLDEDAGNTFDRLQATVIDNANEPYSLVESSHLIARPSPSQGMLAKLVTIGPGATLSVGAVGSGGPTFQVLHDAAASEMPGAATLNAIAAGGGFDAAVGGEQDVFIPLSNGEFIKVTYAASPTGVQVYWDHDAANDFERLLEVVVDNANESYITEVALGWKRDSITAAAAVEVANDVDVGVVEFVAYGLV